MVAGEVSHADAPERVVKGMPRHPIPLIVLARLAVHRKAQGRGLGASLLRDALGRTLNAAEVIGIRALAVHAKDGGCCFLPPFRLYAVAHDPRHLFMIIKDIRLAAEQKP